MKRIIFVLPILLLGACASKTVVTSSSDAVKSLEDRWSPRVGAATKSDFVQDFGNAEWCRVQDSGTETCRFYKKRGTAWMGDDKRDKKSYEQFDEVVADFDGNGKLRTFKANAQR